MTEDNELILFLGFDKAFDLTEKLFNLSCLGFWDTFQNIKQSLYENTNSPVSLPECMSHWFIIKHRVQQVCHFSQFLFIKANEIGTLPLFKLQISLNYKYLGSQ